MTVFNILFNNFMESADLVAKTHARLSSNIQVAMSKLKTAAMLNRTVFWAGNGGSAADAQHMAAELVGRFKQERRPIKSLALTTNTSTLTSVANDYSYDTVFTRELEAFGERGDVFIAISTSGNSKNIVNAAIAARKMGAYVIALTGDSGGELAKYSDLLLNIPSTNTARIQEMHLLIEHTFCEAIEAAVCL
jgi:D-sedoheptulose 7-phosphate isomerase